MPQPLSRELRSLQETVEAAARARGLDFFETIYEVLDWEEINEVAAYGGYPARYPHWRFGMEYVELSRSYAYGLSKIYEMVINNDPTYAYLLAANHFVDQKLVMAHVCGHGDFFKHNFMFAGTNRKMLDEMANHSSRVRRYMERYGVEEVERLLDRCLSIDNLIDYNAPHARAAPRAEPAADHEEESEGREPKRLRAKGYMDPYINPPAALAAERARLDLERKDQERFPARPERDVMLFLLEHAPLKNWERDVLGMLREEAYYFAPQGRTKISNEGWACVEAQTPVFTELGMIPMADLVVGIADTVYDGGRKRKVYGRNVLRDRETVRVRTRRGLELCGSTNHRILLADGVTWRRLDELRAGDPVAMSGGGGLWADSLVELSWLPPHRLTLEDVAKEAGVSLHTVLRHRAGTFRSRRAAAIEDALVSYEDQPEAITHTLPRKRAEVKLPRVVDEPLAAFLGYLIGDGHISRVAHGFGLTSGDEEQIESFAALARSLFGLASQRKRDGGRIRIWLHSETVSDFLVHSLGLSEGPSARVKRIPDVVLRSPEPVVRAFLRAYFDCDGYAGEQGVILSTSSETLSKQVQLLLLNYGILSRRRLQRDGCWHVHVHGASAARFGEKIGFGLTRKQEALERFVASHRWFKAEKWEDEVLSIEHGRADVYDISVADTHRYAAAGFINHNSFWHSKLMTQDLLSPSELIDYADHHSGTMATSPGRLNPYKVGIELWRDIEERWNKGRHGHEWEACDDYARKESWDTGAMRGLEKVFEVRRHYNDVTFIDEFLTPEFVRRHGLFTYEFDRRSNRYLISDRDFHAVKEKLLFMLTNFGQPTIEVADANFLNRGELLLAHRYEGIPLKLDQALETLENVQSLWRRPVNLETVVDDELVVLSYDGVEHRTQNALADRV